MGWELSDRLMALGLTLSAAGIAFVLFWLYEREADRHEERWMKHLADTSNRQLWDRHPVDRDPSLAQRWDPERIRTALPKYVKKH